MSLRILLLDAGREWRGRQRQLLALARGLRQRGHEPLVVAAPDAPTAQRLRQCGVAVSVVPMRGEWDLPSARRLRVLLRTWAPDVVHAFDGRALVLAQAALVGHAEVPLVLSWSAVHAGRSVASAAVRRRRGASGSIVAPLAIGRLRARALRLAAWPTGRVSHVLAPSAATRAAAVAAGVDPRNLSLVHPSVSLSPPERPRDWRAECRWPAEAVVCGVVGVGTTEDGPRRLVDVAAGLPVEIRQRVRLLLLGGGGIGPCRVAGVEAFRAGNVDDLAAALAGVDILLRPCGGGLGTVALEAMALGVPVLAAAGGFLPELIEDGHSGILRAPSEAVALASAAARLVRDPVERARLAAGAAERARAFDVRRMLDEIDSVYARVAAGGPAVAGAH